MKQIMKLTREKFGYWLIGSMLPGLAAFAADLPEEDPLRLDPRIRPITQSIELQLDPAVDSYSGMVRVELQFDISTNVFRFHAQEITFTKAMLDGKAVILKPAEAGIVSATADTPAIIGPHTFEIEFTNDFNCDGTGLYKAVAGGTPYLFTKMEPTDARRAFPCWDEPGFKIPWRLTLTIPNGLEAVGNMPIAQTTLTGSRKVLEFGRTPPMPSYLVTLAVGRFDFLPIPGQSVPGRIVTVPGKTPMARLAASEVPALLSALERYFGLPYPYPKLDHLAVPEHNSSAMENVGAIAYQDSVLLNDPGNVSFGQQQRMVELITHEMAHMWFGNLVTMRWWNDVWLNEALATWLSFKVAGQVHPELRFDLLNQRFVAEARFNDTQPTTKPVRRPFRGGDNLREAFDTLSYQKGQGILGMIEGWIGETNFQTALHRYFVRHSWGNTHAEDLWAAFAEGGDDSLEETLRRYIEQPGIPELSFTRLAGDRCAVRQRRYRTLTAKGVSDQVWHVPIVIRYGDKSGSKTARLLLKKDQDVFNVPGLDQAEWVYPNAGESGYYLWSLPPDLTTALTNRAIPLSTSERSGLLGAAHFAMISGNLSADKLLQLALGFADDPTPQIQDQVTVELVGLRPYFSSNDHPAYAKLLRQTLRPMLENLGYEPKRGEAAELESLRGMLFIALGIVADDPDVVAFCRQAALRQLRDPRSVNAAIAGLTLVVATWHGDEAWSTRLRTAFENASETDVRARFLSSLTRYRDPALVRSGLDYGLTEAVRPAEFRNLFFGPPELAPVRFEWLTQNYDAVKRKIAPQFLPFLTEVLRGGDAALLAEGRAFFLDPARKDALTELKLTELADTIELETTLRQRHSAGLAKLTYSRLARLPE